MSQSADHGGFSAVAYLFAIVGMVMVGVAGIIGIEVVRTGQDNMLIHGLIMGFLTPTIMSVLSLMKAHDTHLIVNSRMDELLKLTKSSEFAKGVLHATGKEMPPPIKERQHDE
jgi:hypothetical protein